MTERMPTGEKEPEFGDTRNRVETPIPANQRFAAIFEDLNDFPQGCTELVLQAQFLPTMDENFLEGRDRLEVNVKKVGEGKLALKGDGFEATITSSGIESGNLPPRLEQYFQYKHVDEEVFTQGGNGEGEWKKRSRNINSNYASGGAGGRRFVYPDRS